MSVGGGLERRREGEASRCTQCSREDYFCRCCCSDALVAVEQAQQCCTVERGEALLPVSNIFADLPQVSMLNADLWMR